MKNIVMFVGVLYTLFIFNIMTPTKLESELERRPLQQFPEVSLELIKSGTFQEELSEYMSDQFAGRDYFRGVKTFIQVNVFGREWNNDVFIKDNNLYEQFDEIEYDVVDTHIKNINRFIGDLDNEVYLTLVPSKSYGVNLPNIDQEMLAKYIAVNIDAEYLDILEYDYENAFMVSDPHWTQSTVIDIYHNYLQKHLIKEQVDYEYVEYTMEEKYYGTLYSSLGTGDYYDYIQYYSNDIIDGLKVCIISRDLCVEGPYLDGEESLYDIFLGGNEPIVIIENDQVEEKELVIFADSFGNAFAPIIAQDYSKVTMIDLRLIQSSFLDYYIEIGDAEILYLYNIKSVNDDYRLTN